MERTNLPSKDAKLKEGNLSIFIPGRTTVSPKKKKNVRGRR